MDWSDMDWSDFNGEVVGESHYGRPLRKIMRRAKPDQNGWRSRHLILTLKAEPRNKHDRDAIAVMYGKRQIGYVPSEETALIRQQFGKRKVRRGINRPGIIMGKDGNFGARYAR